MVSTAGFSVLNTGIFWREAKTKMLFSQCRINLRQSDLLRFIVSLDINSTPFHKKTWLKIESGSTCLLKLGLEFVGLKVRSEPRFLIVQSFHILKKPPLLLFTFALHYTSLNPIFFPNLTFSNDGGRDAR